MTFLWSTAAKDLRRHRHDPLKLVFWLGIPIAIGVLILLSAGGSSGPSPQAHVLVVDRDDSFLSGFLVGALSQDAAGDFIRAEEVEEEEGRERIAKGDGTALLVIPAGFADAILREEPATLELVTNPSQTILPGIVEEGLSIFADGTFYLHRLIGEDLREFAAGPDSGFTFENERIGEFSVKVNELVERLGEYLFPPLLEVVAPEVTEEAEEDEGPSLALLFVPGLLFMSLLFIAQGVSDDLWKERDGHTLRRVLVSPRSLHTFLLGKTLAGAFLMLVISGLALAGAYLYFGLDWRMYPLAAVWCAFSGTVLASMLGLVQVFASSQRGGSMLTMILVFPLLMLGGSFFPFEAMPEGLAAIGRLTPNGWALERLKDILMDRVELETLGLALVGQLLVGAALLFFTELRLRAGFARA